MRISFYLMFGKKYRNIFGALASHKTHSIILFCQHALLGNSLRNVTASLPTRAPEDAAFSWVVP